MIIITRSTVIIVEFIVELWSMLIKFVDIDCFLCNSYPCMLFESLSHVINQESHVYWGKFASFIF